LSDIIDAPASENCEKEEGVMWKDTRNCCIFMWVVFLALCCSPAWGFDFGKIVDGVSNVVDSAQKEVKKVVNSESEKTSGEKSSQSQSQQSSAPDAVVQKSGTVGKADQPLGESLSVFSTSPTVLPVSMQVIIYMACCVQRKAGNSRWVAVII